MQIHTRFPFTFVLIFLIISFAGCDCDDEEDNEDDSDNSPSDDDDNDDDNNDSSDDDDDNDDNDDDDDNDDVQFPGYYWKPGIWIQYILGGAPGYNGTSIAIGPDDTQYIAADMGGVVFLFSKGPSDSNWSKEWVDSLVIEPDMELDSNGRAHLCSYNFDEKNLRYATNASGTWKRVTLDIDGDVGEECSIAIDDNDFVHISYFDYTNKDLKYATNVSGSWIVEAAISSGDCGVESSIDTDSDGYAHISFANYTDFFDSHVFYATNSNGSWDYELIQSFSGESFLLVDTNDVIHISNNDGDLLHVHNTPGYWVTETISTNNKPISSIVSDDQNYLHVAAYDSASDNLYYFNNTAGSWTGVHIVGQTGEGLYNSIALDSNDIPHISHHDTMNYPLLASTNESGSWETETVEEPRLIDWKLSGGIALDNSDIPHIIFFDYNNFSISIAKMNLSGTFDIFVLDSSLYDDTAFGDKNAIGIDFQDNVHVLYNGDDNTLMYATDSSGTWVIEEIQSEIARADMNIVLDQNGSVHTVYRKYTTGTHYFTNVSGSWVSEVIDPDGVDTAAIALEPNGDVHVASLLSKTILA